jgi:hypothetical protein
MDILRRVISMPVPQIRRPLPYKLRSQGRLGHEPTRAPAYEHISNFFHWMRARALIVNAVLVVRGKGIGYVPPTRASFVFLPTCCVGRRYTVYLSPWLVRS